MLIVSLKFIHYLALFLAGGLGVANSILMKAHLKAGVAPAAPVRAATMVLARLGLAAIVLLWLTGIALTLNIYGSFALGWAFHLKLFGATLVLVAIAVMNIHLTQTARAGQGPNLKLAGIITKITRAGLVLVLLGVAILTTL